MIGHTLEARNPYWGGILWLIVAAAFLAITLVTKQLGWAVFGILPAAVGVAFLFSNPPDFYAEVTPSELIVHSHQQTIPYREIRRVWYPGSNARAVYVQHSRGVLRIPRTFKASAAQIHAFLCSVQPPAPPPDVHPTIRHYYQTQLHTFGMDRVWAHNARLEYLEYENRRSKLVGWALSVTVVGWIIASIATKDYGWSGAAVLLALVALLAYVLRGSIATAGRRIKNWREASLVIGPAGLALSQGDLTGELRWKELRDVKFKDKAATGQRRIELRVEGAQINIMDLYDSPMNEIHRQITQYWNAG